MKRQTNGTHIFGIEHSKRYWNNWFVVGNISKEDFETLKTDQDYLSWFYEKGYINTDSPIILEIMDDQYNIIVCNSETQRPLLAIEYGLEY